MGLKLLFLLFSFSLSAQAGGIFKDLRTYYEACGLIGKKDPRFEACNPPNMSQIMESFKKDPKNKKDMEKIARFHMTHSLQKEGKESLKELQKEMLSKPRSLKEMKDVWKNNHLFVISFSPACGEKTSLELGQKLKNYTERKKEVLTETLHSLKKYPCLKDPKKFKIYAVGVVDVTERPDVWEMNEKGELRQIVRSTGKTPFTD